ncbi:hypothetical protein D3C73_1534560 [compost metagenome]
MRSKILRFEHPSIFPASSSSFGSVLKNPVKISTDSGSPIAVYTSTSDNCVFSSCMLFISMNSGTIPSLIGIIIPIKKKKNSAGFHLKGKRAI